MIAIPGLYVSEDGHGKVVFGISAKGHSIIDPTVDESTINGVEPSYYGLTQEQVDLFEKLNDVLDTAMEDALNAGCLAVQKALEIPEGDVAALYFSGNQQTAPVRQAFALYIISEINMNTGTGQDS
jgi:hypothetical protein